MANSDRPPFQAHILQLEQDGFLTRTFRRLDPERQQAVIDAILDEAIDKGPARINIKRVAARAGVSVGSLYQYFHNRAGLLDFAIALTVRWMTASLSQYRDALAALPLREALLAYVMGGLEWSKEQAAFMRFFARAAYHGETPLSQSLVRPIAKVLREMINEMLIQAAKRGEIRKGVDLEAVHRVIYALTIAIADSQLLPYLNNYFQVTDKKMSVNRTLEAMVDLIMQGIGSPKK